MQLLSFLGGKKMKEPKREGEAEIEAGVSQLLQNQFQSTQVEITAFGRAIPQKVLT